MSKCKTFIITFILLSLVICMGCANEKKNEIRINLPALAALDMIFIPAGSFKMGSDTMENGHEEDEDPVHLVTIGYDYYLGKTEITQSQWLSVMKKRPDSLNQPNSEEGLGDDYPAYYISWEDCQTFLLKLNEIIKTSGQGSVSVRLPTEAEWEYACRAGTETRFYFGDSLNLADGTNAGDYMWYRGNNQPAGAKPVAKKRPNSWGLYDMHGNVWEWCQDWYHPSYEDAPTDGSAWEHPQGIYRILHGGDWDNKAKACRSANRNDHRVPTDRSADLGFRIVGILD